MEQTKKTEPKAAVSNEPTREKPKTEASNKPLLTKEIMDLVKRAEAGDFSVLPQISDFLDKRPDLWQKLGDLRRYVENLLVTIVSGASPFIHEVVRRRLDELRAELAGPAPSSLEKLLVDRICVCWLQVHSADVSDANRPQSETTRRQNAAQTRYLAAIRQLALVRRLLRPAPSALDLLKVPVNETSTNTPTRSLRGGLRLQTGVEDSCLQGAGIEN